MSRNKKKRVPVQNNGSRSQVKNSAVQTTKNQAAAAQTAVVTNKVDQKVPKQQATAQEPEKIMPEQKAPVLKKSSETGQPDTGLLQNVKEHLLSANPVLVKAVVVVPILGAATALKNGIMLSGTMLLTVVILNLIMYPLYRIIPRGYRFAVSFLAAGAAITPVYMLAKYLAPTVATQCSIYLPLLAVCALPLIEKRHYGKKFGIAKTALNAALDGVGFAIAAIVFSIIREIIGNGTLYDRTLPYFSQMKFSFALMPAGAFLLLGLLVALFRKIYGIHDNDVHDDDGGFYK